MSKIGKLTLPSALTTPWLSLLVLQVEQARFMAPPFTLKDAVPSEEEEQHQQPQMQQPRKADPPQQGGTRSLLADLRYPPAACSSQLHL